MVLLKTRNKPFWKLELDGLSQSMISLFRTCPMKFRYRYIEAIEKPRPDNALEFGDFFHHCLDRLYSHCIEKPQSKQYFWDAGSKVFKIEYDRAKKRLLENADVSDLQTFEQVYGLCRTLLEPYAKRWHVDDAKLTWVAVEQVFEYNYDLLELLIPLRGKLDGLVRDSKGKLWLFETKTKSTIEGSYILGRLGFDLQVMTYMKAVESIYGERPIGVIYNLVKRPGQRYTGSFNRQTETLPMFLDRVRIDIESKPNTYFMRYHVSISWDEVENFHKNDLQYALKSIYDWNEDRVGARDSRSCPMFNKPCEYLQICSGGGRFSYQRKSKLFPELIEGNYE